MQGKRVAINNERFNGFYNMLDTRPDGLILPISAR